MAFKLVTSVPVATAIASTEIGTGAVYVIVFSKAVLMAKAVPVIAVIEVSTVIVPPGVGVFVDTMLFKSAAAAVVIASTALIVKGTDGLREIQLEPAARTVLISAAVPKIESILVALTINVPPLYAATNVSALTEVPVIVIVTGAGNT